MKPQRAVTRKCNLGRLYCYRCDNTAPSRKGCPVCGQSRAFYRVTRPSRSMSEPVVDAEPEAEEPYGARRIYRSRSATGRVRSWGAE